MFIGRQKELENLNRFLQKKTASLIVVKGRRRIGKSRLIEEFASPFKFYSFTGIPPTPHTTAQTQRDEFALQLGQHMKLPGIKSDDWNTLFLLLAQKTKHGRTIILFDEISWMGSKDPDFLGKLKTTWDMHFKKNDQLIFVICGSASSWIEKNILSSTGFLGRISYTLTLRELPIQDCNLFWPKKAKVSAFEKFKILAVTGGVPRYLEEIDTTVTAEDNIKRMCFSEGGLLVNEFNNIFSDLFLHNSAMYKKIVKSLVKGSKEIKEICKDLKIQQSGRMSEYLNELELAGFVVRDYAWNLLSGIDSKSSKYRLSDNYVRFYIKYVNKHLTKIQRGHFTPPSLTSLQGWESIMGLQFENFVINNAPFIYEALNLRQEEIVAANPYFQRKTLIQKGCQIDYMIQTKFGTIYLCEIKFSKNHISSNVITEVQKKVEAIKTPKAFSIRPVLIHVNGVSNHLVEAEYFANIIDFSKILHRAVQ
ncbi:MAG: ATP-binding protein [Pseudomonadota bacterium]